MYELLAAGIVNVLQWKYLVPLFLGTLIGVVGGALPGDHDHAHGHRGAAVHLRPRAAAGARGDDRRLRRRRDRRPDRLVPARHSRQAVGGRDDLRRVSDVAQGRAGARGLARHLGVDLRRAARRDRPVGATGPLAKFALEFGPWEYFSLFVLALSMVAGLVESSLSKGLLSGALGLIVTVLGGDPVLGQPRLTFGIEFIEGGISFLPVLIGVFAFGQIMSEVERMGGAARRGGRPRRPGDPARRAHGKVIWEILSRPFLLLWASFIGLVIGVLPAIGGSAANMLAYDQAKKFSRHPEKFGTGVPGGHHRLRGVEQCERRRVAGDHHGVRHPGRRGHRGDARRADDPRHPVGAALHLAERRARLRHVRGVHRRARGRARDPRGSACAGRSTSSWCRSGSCSRWCWCCAWSARTRSTTRSANVYVLAAFGVLGYLMVKFGFPLAPFILGVILGDQIEINLIRAIMTDPDPWLFLTRPISGVLLVASVASVVAALWQHRRHQRRAAAPGAPRRRPISELWAAIVERTRTALALRRAAADRHRAGRRRGRGRAVRRAERFEPRAQAARGPGARADEGRGRAQPADAAGAAAHRRRHHADARRGARTSTRSSSTICSS